MPCLQEFELQFTDGVLSVGEIQLGDAGPLAVDLRDLVADASGCPWAAST